MHLEPDKSAVKQTKDIESRRRTLEAIHDNAVDAIITINERGTIDTVNPATELLFGYSSEELVGNNVSMLMPAPYREEHDGYLKNYMEGGVRKIIGIGRQVVARKKDGSVFPMHLAVSEVQLHDRRVFAGFIRDLTNLKLVEEQQATLGRIIEDSLNEVYIFDAETLRFIQVNRGARENLGYTLEELQQLTPFDIKPDYDEADFRSAINPLLVGNRETVEFSTKHLRKNGSTYDVEVHLQMSTYLTQTVFVAIILDITKRKQAERTIQEQQDQMKAELERLVETRTTELRQTQEELIDSEKYSTLGKVSGGIAHEIRNPLNAVKTSAYYLLNAKDPSPEKTREHLQRIDRQVSMIDNVITALSDVAKLPEANLRPVAVERILRDVVRTTSLPANIHVEFDFPENIPLALVDENQIMIAFRNLIRNARDAMPDGGTIRLFATTDHDTVSFSVEDTGIGIAEEDLKRILEPLFTTKARGMGLGLSITRAIVDKNRAELSLESKPGHGSLFSIRLQKQN